MRRVSRSIWRTAALIVLASLSGLAWTADPVAMPDPAVGMSAAEVRKLLGPPKRIARQILYRRYLEQWTFDAPIPRVIELECVKGQDPRVVTIYKLPEAKP